MERAKGHSPERKIVANGEGILILDEGVDFR
jgi:hypothetical protein